MKSKINVGIIGCGKISNAYLKGCANYDIFNVTACADLDLDRARAKATEFSISKACSTQELIADPEIDLIVNLTIPKAHAEINLAAIAAGKHVWCEKPFVTSREESREVLTAAHARGRAHASKFFPLYSGARQSQRCRRLRSSTRFLQRRCQRSPI